MTPGLVAMLVGVFVVPAMLVWVGHRLRRRSAAVRSAFWGAVTGHLIAIVPGLTFAMIPPEEWSADDRWRGAMALWSYLVLPIAGAAVGWVMKRGWRGAPGHLPTRR